MATTSAIPGSTASSDGSGLVTWTGLSSLFASDNARASADDSAITEGPSDVLKITGFNFAGQGIGTSDTILAIKVAFERRASGNSTHDFVKDSVVRLLIGGALSGNNKAVTGTKWPTTDTVANYGDTVSDLWGLSPTGTQVRASDFGVGISVTFGDFGSVADIDYVTIQIAYATLAEPEEVHISSSRVMMQQP